MLTATPSPSRLFSFLSNLYEGNWNQCARRRVSAIAAHYQGMSQVTKVFMVLREWEKRTVLSLLGSKTISCTTCLYIPQTLLNRSRSKRKQFPDQNERDLVSCSKTDRKRMRGNQRRSAGNAALHPFKI